MFVISFGGILNYVKRHSRLALMQILENLKKILVEGDVWERL